MRIRVPLLAVVAAAPLAACAPHKVDTQQVATIKKIGILSVSIDRIGTAPSDLTVLQRAVDAAPADYEAALKVANPGWEVVPLGTYKDNVAFSHFLAPDSPVLAEQGQKDTRMQFTAKLLNAEGGPTGMVERWIQPQSAGLVGATGLPLIPYVAARPQGTTATTQSGKMTTTTNDQGMHDYFLKSVGALADKLGVDALAIVYLHTEIKATVGINTIVNGRGIDSIRMKPTLVVVDKAGKAAIDLGEPVIDDLTQRAAGAPVYRVTGPTNAPTMVIDLADPQGKVLPDFQELIAKTSQTVGEKLAKQMAPPAPK